MSAAQQHSFGVVPVETMKQMSGMEFLTAMRDGALPAPPIMQMLGYGLVALETGRVTFEATPRIEHYNPIGSVHAGFAATLLDSAMACAVHSTLAAGIGYTTLEFKISLVRAITATTGLVRAEGSILTSGRRVATAEGRLVDAAGRLCAHATTTCLVFEL